MKQGRSLFFPVAVACLVLLAPAFVRAEDDTAASAVNAAAAQQEANQMVPVRAHLLKVIDARKAQVGDQFQAVVDGTVQLKNGTELPRGTTLIGVVAADQNQAGGNAQLALRFTQAKLKSGQVVPIEAMIAGVAVPAGDTGYQYGGDDALPSWNSSILQVDVIKAVSNADLHSMIAAPDSGTFVSTKRDDVKLAEGSRLTLAVAAQGSDNATAAGGSAE